MKQSSKNSLESDPRIQGQRKQMRTVKMKNKMMSLKVNQMKRERTRHRRRKARMS